MRAQFDFSTAIFAWIFDYSGKGVLKINILPIPYCIYCIRLLPIAYCQLAYCLLASCPCHGPGLGPCPPPTPPKSLAVAMLLFDGVRQLFYGDTTYPPPHPTSIAIGHICIIHTYTYILLCNIYICEGANHAETPAAEPGYFACSCVPGQSQ